MIHRTYIETFDHGPGGWFGWIDNFQGPKRLDTVPSGLISRSPWWIDYNHAPPGAGYLHMLFSLLTTGPGFGEAYIEAGGANQFVEQGFPTDFRNAGVSLTLKGEVETRGAELVLLIQGSTQGITSGWCLTGSPFKVTGEFTKQTVTLVPDESKWTCLGSRYNRTKSYGKLPLEQVLRNVNGDILLVLFPLNVEPMGPLTGEPHQLRPGKDYPVWTSRLPEGYVVLDEVRIDFAVD